MDIDINRIKNHKQIATNSCVPMSVELVLKLLNLMSASDFSLQGDPSKSGNSNWIKKGFDYPYEDPTVKFDREFLLSDLGFPTDRGVHFMQSYYEPLFNTIDSELANNRYVIISLESGPNQWHMEVIFDKVSDGIYKTITFYHGQPEFKIYEEQKVKERVEKMEGTDILTYKYI